MKKDLFLFFLGAVCLYAMGCQKKETVMTSIARPEKDMGLLKGQIIHLYHDTAYILSQTFVRNAGEQLIIDEGTLIKARPGFANIIINAGALIQANGTRSNPIVFTSNEAPGSQNRNWGGIIITGKSINNSNNSTGDATDVSGSLHFVRIEFAGLTVKSVGNRTIIEHVQVSYADRSSFVIEGGTFNARNLVSYSCGGAADFYITEGYSGNLQYLLAHRHPFFGKAATEPFNALTGIFIENHPFNPVHARPYTYPVISNATIIGPNGQNGMAPAYHDSLIMTAALVTSGSTGFRIRNSIMLGFPGGGWQLGDELTATGVHHNISEFAWNVVHTNYRPRAFYLKPGVYPPFGSNDFEGYMLKPEYHNQVAENTAVFMLKDPFNYELPDVVPQQNSPLLEGAGFEGTDYSDPFFVSVNFRGALGTDNWLKDWTNFTPLKTYYNYPR